MAETTKKAKAPAKPKKAPAENAVAPKPAAKKAEETKSTIKKAAAKKVVTKKTEETTGIAIVKPVSQEEVAALAHRFWAERGYKHGHHLEDWIRAEQELRGKAS